MIIKTLQITCDRDGCLSFYEGDAGESRALVVIKQARAVGWEATGGKQYCPEHRHDWNTCPHCTCTSTVCCYCGVARHVDGGAS